MVVQNHGSRKIFAEINKSRGLLFLMVVCISQSHCFHKLVSQNQFFHLAKKAAKYRFVYIILCMNLNNVGTSQACI